MQPCVNFQTSEFIALCQSHKVKELYAFGSVVDGGFTEQSDIDLLVEFDEPNPIKKGKLILSLYDKLQKLFKRDVDLLTLESIRNPIFEEYIEVSKKLVYHG